MMLPRCPVCRDWQPLVAKPKDGVFGDWTVEPCCSIEILTLEMKMSYTMQAGDVYQLARSLRHPEVYALPVGKFAPDVVSVDEETAGQMQYSGVLVYMDGQCVAIFIHPDDPNFVMGQPVDPEAEDAEVIQGMAANGSGEDGALETQEEQPAEVPVEEPNIEAANITPEQMAEWGYAEDAVCESCGYYIKDHTFDGASLQCPASEG